MFNNTDVACTLGAAAFAKSSAFITSDARARGGRARRIGKDRRKSIIHVSIQYYYTRVDHNGGELHVTLKRLEMRSGAPPPLAPLPHVSPARTLKIM